MTDTDLRQKPSLTQCVQALKRSPSILVLIALAVAGFACHSALQKRVFPSASIDMKYSRKQIRQMARDWSAKLGYEPANTITSIKFGGDSEAQTFLERQYGQADANRLMSVLPVWYWECRFMKEYQTEQVKVQVSPKGELYRFEHTLENDRRIPSLDRNHAEAMAKQFVAKEAGISLDTWKEIKSEDTTQVNRTDHSFQWEEAASAADYKGAHRRVSVDVCGNIIGLYDLSLHTPQSWKRSYDTMRSYNKLFESIAFFVFLGLAVGTFFLFAQAVARKSFSIKTAIIIGGIFAAATIAGSLNDYPSWACDFTPDESYRGWLIRQLALQISEGLAGGVLIAMLAAAAQPMYRWLNPGKLQIKEWFTFKGLRTAQFLEGTLVGYATCAIVQGYQIAYYFLGERIGYWCPFESDKYEVIGSAFPFVNALSIGVLATTMEEGLYRVIGLGLFQKLCRGNFWLANFLQAAAWGFMHSTYPQQPAFARGLELTIEGMFNGWILKRYGLLACIIEHYLFDVFCGIEPLGAAPASISWTAMIPVAIPAVVAVVGLTLAWRNGFAITTPASDHPSEEEHAPSATSSTTVKPEPALTTFCYDKPLGGRTRAAICFIGAVGLAALLYFQLPVIGRHSSPLTVSRNEAVAIAKKYWLQHGVDPTGYLVSTELESGMGQRPYVSYMYEKLGFQRTKEIIESVERGLQWRVRFCKPLQAQEYSLFLDASGKILAPVVTTPEDAPERTLSEADAQNMAESFLREYRPEYQPFVLRDKLTNVRKARTDYRFTFVVPRWKADRADLIVNVDVEGDRVSGLSHEWLVPDNWQSKFKATSQIESVFGILRPLALAAGAILALWFLVDLLRGGLIRWKWVAWAAAVVVPVSLLDALNSLPAYYNNYDTTTPLNSYMVTYVVEVIGIVIAGRFALLLLFSLATGALKKYCPDFDLPSALRFAFTVQPKAERRHQNDLWLDGILVASIVSVALGIVSATIDVLQGWFAHEPAMENLPGNLEFTNLYNLPFGAFAGDVTFALVAISMLVVVPALLKHFFKGRTIPCALVVVATVLIFDVHTKYVPDFLLAAVHQILTYLIVWLLLIRPGRKNPMAVLIWVWAGLVTTISVIYRQGLPLLTNDFCGMLLLLISPLVYLAYLQLAPAPKPAVVVSGVVTMPEDAELDTNAAGGV